MIKRIMATLLLAVTGTVHAAGLDLSLSDTTASFVLLTDSSSLGYGGADVGFGVLYNENDDIIFNASFMVVGNPASSQRPVQFGVGAKAYVGNYDKADLDVGALAIGAQLRFVIPSALAPMAATVGFYYAPDIVSFSDADSLTELTFRFEFEIVPSTSAYFGYRRLEVDFKDLNDAEFDDSFHLGIRISFD